jgi:CheY-like chemotaxis protein
MNMIGSADPATNFSFQANRAIARQALVVIVCDAPETAEQLRTVCSFFDVAVEVLPDGEDLMQLLLEQRPMAMICDMEGRRQDGFHSLKVVASYDRDLPVLLLTAGDPVLMGAADAVQEMWNLTMITRSTGSSLAGQLADFLSTAGRRAGCMRLVQV